MLLTPEPYTPEHRKSLTPEHRKPLTPEVYTPSGTSPFRENSKMAPPPSTVPLNVFMEYIAAKIRSKWRFFGIMIEIPADVLDSFPADNCLQCFERVFLFWKRRGTPSVSWDTIISVLDSGTVDEKKLADDIKQTFLPPIHQKGEDEGIDTPSESHHSKKNKSSDSAYGSTSTRMVVSDV